MPVAVHRSTGQWPLAGSPARKSVTLGSETAVRFYYDSKSTDVRDSENGFVAVAAGSFQSELGCTEQIGGSGLKDVILFGCCMCVCV